MFTVALWGKQAQQGPIELSWVLWLYFVRKWPKAPRNVPICGNVVKTLRLHVTAHMAGP